MKTIYGKVGTGPSRQLRVKGSPKKISLNDWLEVKDIPLVAGQRWYKVRVYKIQDGVGFNKMYFVEL